MNPRPGPGACARTRPPPPRDGRERPAASGPLEDDPPPAGQPAPGSPGIEHPTRRTLNVKLFLGLIIAAGLLGGGLHPMHGFQEARNAGTLLKWADREEQKGDPGQEEKYLSRYLNTL